MATWKRGLGCPLAARVVMTLLGVLAFSRPANANDGLLNPGSLIVAAERLMGAARQSFREPSITTNTYTYNTVALFGSSPTSGASLGHSMLPRIGFDGVLGPGITLGASGIYTRTTGEVRASTTINGTREQASAELPKGWQIVAHPRVGYFAGLSEHWGFWGRLGLVYSHLAISGTGEVDGMTTTVESRSSFANVSVELLMIASPVPHAGFIFGPFLEGGLTGSRQDDVARYSRDKVSYSAVGVTAGICLML